MQICDLDFCDSDYCTVTQVEIIEGGAIKAIALSGASATSFGLLSVTKTRSLTQTITGPYQAVSLGSATALSIASPVKNASGVLASGRATVSSLGSAQS